MRDLAMTIADGYLFKVKELKSCKNPVLYVNCGRDGRDKRIATFEDESAAETFLEIIDSIAHPPRF